jgi:hypothetical protein
MHTFPIYRAEGNHRDLGRAHGEQARSHIHGHLDGMCRAEQWSRATLEDRALRFEPLFRNYCPHLLEEIGGLAEGAGISLGAALATNIRSVLSTAQGKSTQQDGCTSFVVAPQATANNVMLAGQNSDMLPETSEWAYVLHLKPLGKPETLMWSFGGMIGYHGFNEHGIGQFANDLGGGPARQFAMPQYPIKRLLMECRDMAQVNEVFDTIPVAVNGNYVLCGSGGEIVDIETTTEGPHRITDEGSGFIAHSNHFVCVDHATPENFAESAADSFRRLDRMNRLLESRVGSLTPNDLKEFLRDRENAPSAICRSVQTAAPGATWVTAGMTVASIVAEPTERRMHIARGDEPDAPFVTYSMDPLG